MRNSGSHADIWNIILWTNWQITWFDHHSCNLPFAERAFEYFGSQHQIKQIFVKLFWNTSLTYYVRWHLTHFENQKTFCILVKGFSCSGTRCILRLFRNVHFSLLIYLLPYIYLDILGYLGYMYRIAVAFYFATEWLSELLNLLFTWDLSKRQIWNSQKKTNLKFTKISIMLSNWGINLWLYKQATNKNIWQIYQSLEEAWHPFVLQNVFSLQDAAFKEVFEIGTKFKNLW